MTLYFVRIAEKNGEYEYGTPILIRAGSDAEADEKAHAHVRQWRGGGEPLDPDDLDGQWEFGEGLVAELEQVTAIATLADLERVMSVLEPEHCEVCGALGFRISSDGVAYCREHDPDPIMADVE